MRSPGGGERAGRQRRGGATTLMDCWWEARGARTRDGLVVGLLALLTVVLFAPFLFSDRMLFGSDIIPMGYAARKIYADFVREHLAMPLWNPYILGGLPFAEAFHGDIFYPASLLYLLFPVDRAIGMKLVLHVFVAGLTMYVYLRGLDLRRTAAVPGAVAYMFAPYLISLIFAGHDAKMYVTALFPLFLYALERLGRGGGLYHAALGGGVVGLMLLSAHVQMAYFALWGGAIYSAALVARTYRRERNWTPVVRLAGLIILVVCLGLAVGLAQLLPSYLYTKEFSPRAGGVDYAYAASWSLHAEEVVSLVVPQFGGYMDTYWGRNPFKLNCESPGLLVIFLALAGVLWYRRWPTWLALGISLLALAYALGAHTPVHRFFFRVMPGVKMFRAPSIIMFLFSWGMVTVGAVSLARLDEARGGEEGIRSGKGILALAGGAVLVLIMAAAVGGGLYSWWISHFYGDISPAAQAAARHGVSALRHGLLWASFSVGAAAAAIAWRRRLGRVGLALILTALLVAGDWWVGRDFVKPVRLEDYIVEDAIVRYLREDPDIFRVLPVTGSDQFDQNYLPIFGVQTANGFHDNRMASYDRFLQVQGGLSFRSLALLNVKYLVTQGPVGEHPILAEVTHTRRGYLVLNRGVLPRAFLVHGYRVMDDEAAVEELLQGDMDLRREVILAEDPGLSLVDSPGEEALEEV